MWVQSFECENPPVHLISWASWSNCAHHLFPGYFLFSLWGLELFLFHLYLLFPQSLLFPIAESAGFHPTLYTSEASPNVCIMTLCLSYLFLSGFCFWSSLLCFHSTSPPFNLISPKILLIACNYWCVYMCMCTCECAFLMYCIMQNLFFGYLCIDEWFCVCM